ncbi:sugar-binding transcriptional regulator [Paenibacillus chitinolyticus]|uniref:sugar-binding transcriptional regulator n=1 Tax=Paenibacillus chitinolyticus TaxID=79263 RepID=UPI0026E502A8|nr:sugar-binding domain-containing protein [Paenibacillus chitinolyticus]GKS12080.1 central glycolytic genes regulator [Paenibacillus chitinolyticus]
MRDILDVQKQLLPDLLEVLNKRYTVLQHIFLLGSVGRRTLAGALDMTERVLRSEVEFLKGQGLIETETSGMRISESGRELLEKLQPLIKEMLGLNELEKRIRDHFRLEQVVVVPGDSDSSLFAKKELGRAAALMLRKHVTKHDVIAVTGGSTMAEVAEHLSTTSALKGSLFVPARGGLGESVELQANMIASKMAKKTGGQYRLLHVPDHLREEAYQSLIQEPNIQEMMDVVRSSRIVIHGIGDAIVMAQRRKVDSETIDSLRGEGALAEAFGYYFNPEGKVVHKMPTVGLRLEDIQHCEVVIGVAGGKSKGAAVASVLKYGQEDILVTDEAAAVEMLNHTLS